MHEQPGLVQTVLRKKVSHYLPAERSSSYGTDLRERKVSDTYLKNGERAMNGPTAGLRRGDLQGKQVRVAISHSPTKVSTYLTSPRSTYLSDVGVSETKALRRLDFEDSPVNERPGEVAVHQYCR